MSDINKFTSKEVLNKVLLDSSGNAVEAFSHTTQEALNAALDTTNNRLNVSLAGGTISGDVTISGDLTVNGNGSGNYDEIINGNLVLSSGSKLGIGIGDADPASSLEIKGSTNTLSKITLTNTNPDPDNIWSIHANYNSQELKINGDSTTVLTLLDTGDATFAGDVKVTDNLIIDSTAGNPANQKIQFHDDNVGLQRASGSDRTANGNSLYVSAFEDIVFTASGAVMGSQTERMRIADDGAITVNASTSSGTKFISGSSSFSITPDGNNCVVKLDKSATNRGARFEYSTGTSAKWYQGLSDSDHFSSGGDEYYIAEDLSGEPDFIIEPGGNIGMGMLPNISSGASGTKVLTISATASAKNALIELKGTRTGDGDFSSYIRSFSNSGSTPITDIVSKRGASDTAGSLELYTSNALALTLDSSQNTTFSGDVNIGSGKNINFSPSVYTSAVQGIKFDQDGGTADAIIQPVRVGDVGVLLYLGSNTFVNTSGGNDRYNDSEESAGIEVRHDGQIRFLTGGTGADPTAKMVIDSNSRISLSNNDSGTSNTVLGKLAGNALASGGNYNVLIGEDAGNDLTTGERNVVVGFGALDRGTTESDDNVAIGWEALHGNHTTAAVNDCVAIGSQAIGVGTLTADASGSVGIGYKTLTALTSGAGNTAVGFESGKSITTGARNTAVGYASMDGLDVGEDNVAVGWYALGGASTTSTNQRNVAIGVGSMSGTNAGAGYNVAVGYGTLDANMTSAADNNTGVGYLALSGVTSGANNTGIGQDSLKAVTTGGYNVSVGARSGDALIDGDFNVFVGDFAGSSTTSVNNAVFIGQSAGGGADVSADGSVGIGLSALTALVGGVQNTAVGHQSLSETTQGGYNTTLGYNTMYRDAGLANNHNTFIGANAGSGDWTTTACTSNTGVGSGVMQGAMEGATNNTAVGLDGLNAITTGDNNTAMGRSSLDALTTGVQNTAVGAFSLSTSQAANNCVAIGYNAMNALNTQEGSVAVGMDALNALTTGLGNTAIGFKALDLISTSSNNTAVGYNALTACGDSYSNVAIGKDAGDTITNSGGLNTVIGTGADVSTGAAENQIVLGNGAEGVANNTATIGNASIAKVYMGNTSGKGTATVHCTGIRNNFRDAVSVGTSATAIGEASQYGALAMVWMNSGGNMAHDLVSYSLSDVDVIASQGISGSAAARTYSAASGVLKVAMASGTYDVYAVEIRVTT
tara:strand:- start:544 stop:4182 length:3639 start_codon:yes stop_codon:yes gene_type:complete